MNFVGVDNSQLGLIVSHLFQGSNTQLVHGRVQLLKIDTKIQHKKLLKNEQKICAHLHHVGPDSIDVLSTLQPHDLQDPGGERVVIDPPASPESGGDDGRFWDQVQVVQVSHALADLPAVDVLAVEVGLEAGVEIGVALHWARGHETDSRSWEKGMRQ